jgi:hypothetical protein
MYILLNSEGQIQTYPYSYRQLKSDNPGTSFPSIPSVELLAEWGVYPVVQTPPQNYNLLTQNLIELSPSKIDNVWTQAWQVTNATTEEIADRTANYNARQKQNRLDAYAQKADPLFFKWQRGEGTEAEWLGKVAEIKVFYPYFL